MARWWSKADTPTCSSGTDCMRDCITGSLRPPTSWQPRPDKGRRYIDDGNHTSLYASRADSESAATYQGLRGVSEDGRHLGAPAAVRGLRPRRMLRLVKEQARDQALPRDRPSSGQVTRAWRELDVLLRRRRHVRDRLTGFPPCLRGRVGWGLPRLPASLPTPAS